MGEKGVFFLFSLFFFFLEKMSFCEIILYLSSSLIPTEPASPGFQSRSSYQIGQNGIQYTPGRSSAAGGGAKSQRKISRKRTGNIYLKKNPFIGQFTSQLIYRRTSDKILSLPIKICPLRPHASKIKIFKGPRAHDQNIYKMNDPSQSKPCQLSVINCRSLLACMRKERRI